MPDPLALAPGPYTARILRASLRDAEQLLDEVLEAGSERRSGAGITTLLEWARSQKNAALILGIFDVNLDTAERLLRVCRELVESIATLLEADPMPLAAPTVLERSLGEAVMRLCYIFDASVSPARTIARMAAYQLESIEGNLQGSEAFGRNGREDAENAKKNIAGMQKMLSEGGFDVAPDRKSPLSVSLALDGQRENLKFNATDAYRRYQPTSPWQWELGSGLTHGKGWMLAGLIPTLQTESLTTAEESAVSVGTAVLELGDALARVAAAHSGADVDWFLKKQHQRRMGLTARTREADGFAVGHAEYASRTVDWKPKPGHLGVGFRRDGDHEQ